MDGQQQGGAWGQRSLAGPTAQLRVELAEQGQAQLMLNRHAAQRLAISCEPSRTIRRSNLSAAGVAHNYGPQLGQDGRAVEHGFVAPVTVNPDDQQMKVWLATA